MGEGEREEREREGRERSIQKMEEIGNQNLCTWHSSEPTDKLASP